MDEGSKYYPIRMEIGSDLRAESGESKATVHTT